MCYLKNLEQEQIDFEDFFMKGEESSGEGASTVEGNVLIPCVEKKMQTSWSSEQQKLIQLFDLIERNNQIISSLSRSFHKNSEQVEKSSSLTESLESNNSGKETVKSSIPAPDNSTLSSVLFGNKQYKYSLRLSAPFCTNLFKERNFNLSVQLINKNGDIIRNRNILNLSFGICTNDGEWILENRMGEPFMKGKTQVELYNGQASYMKLYGRDVTRNYKDGKINIVIYPKPSALLFSNPGGIETNINSEEIEPLIIENVVIKAKKKEI